MNTALQPDAPLLTCVVGNDNIIVLVMGGAITGESFKPWAEKVRQAMMQVAAIDKTRVLTLIDVRMLHRVDLDTITELHHLMIFNRNYATRTAVFGANPIISAITHAAIVATHRYTMKLFTTKDMAVEWLLSPNALPVEG